MMTNLCMAPCVFECAKKIAAIKELLYFYSYENKGSIIGNGEAKYI